MQQTEKYNRFSKEYKEDVEEYLIIASTMKCNCKECLLKGSTGNTCWYHGCGGFGGGSSDCGCYIGVRDKIEKEAKKYMLTNNFHQDTFNTYLSVVSVLYCHCEECEKKNTCGRHGCSGFKNNKDCGCCWKQKKELEEIERQKYQKKFERYYALSEDPYKLHNSINTIDENNENNEVYDPYALPEDPYKLHNSINTIDENEWEYIDSDSIDYFFNSMQ